MRRHLGEFEQLLLLALAQLGAVQTDAYGVSIAALIRDRTGRTMSPGAIYTALDRLERRGFVDSHLGEPTPERGGRRKRYYRLRPAGRTALTDMRAALAAMARGLKSSVHSR